MASDAANGGEEALLCRLLLTPSCSAGLSVLFVIDD
jgi:hypothetical protein